MSHTFVIFGASGDLTARKLIPSLYRLFVKGRLPKLFQIVGAARSAFSDDAWRDYLRARVSETFPKNFNENTWSLFAQRLFYHATNLTDSSAFALLNARLQSIEANPSENVTRVYYLATSPALYETTAQHLHQQGMLAPPHRLVIEKPFGRDKNSAQKLNESLHSVIDEARLLRIDHYLGKETVNNILALRFANAIFEPLWNNHHVASIQITAHENGTVGHRGGYYDFAGILRDMVQNHLLQLLTFVTMEPPASLDAKSIRDEKVKLLRAIRPLAADEVKVNTLRGQYNGYRSEKDVSAESQTATFAAVKLMIDNWRWKGVPIFLRTGKGMSCRTTQIVIDFKNPPHLLHAINSRGNASATSSINATRANRLLLQIQPAEGIELYLQTKVPDQDRAVRTTSLSFNFRESFHGDMPDSYERLLLDALNGDASLFARSDEVIAAWEIIDPIQNGWDTQRVPLEIYDRDGWGPASSENWIASLGGGAWFDLCPLLPQE